jgi:hypothetical protein
MFHRTISPSCCIISDWFSIRFLLASAESKNIMSTSWLTFLFCIERRDEMAINIVVYQKTLISTPIMLTPLLSRAIAYVLCSYLLRLYPVAAPLEEDPSCGASIDVPANSLQLVRSDPVQKIASGPRQQSRSYFQVS